MLKQKKNSISSKTSKNVSTKEYVETIAYLKKQIQQAQLKAALSANKELIKLYWLMGKTITEKQEKDGWGSNIIERLIKDLQADFPGIAGFSRANVFRMKAFFLAYSKVAQPARQFEELPIFRIPWFHNVILIQKLKDTVQRLWYAQRAIQNGWSRNMLEMWINSDLYHREAKAITNFHKTLPSAQSDLAAQSLKDPYYFEFLTLHEEHVEKELEQGLIDNIQKLLLELGQGFAFIGRQVHLTVGDEDYYLDLLFYHVKLHCFFIVELKNTKFKPEYAGKMAFYLSAVDETLKSSNDNPTIGLLLCKSKNKLTVEYALRDSNKPIGVASYATKLVESLPKELKSSLPTVQEIEAELEKKEVLAEVEQKKQ